MQYVGQTEVAVGQYDPLQKEQRERTRLTKEQSLIGVAMDQAAHGRVGMLMERVESQLRVVGQHPGLDRNELAEHGIVARIGPVDAAEDVRGHASRHGGGLDAVDHVRHKLVAGLDLLVRVGNGNIVHRDLVRKHLLKEVGQLELALNSVLDLWVSVCVREVN